MSEEEQNAKQLLEYFSYMMDALKNADKNQTIGHFLENLELGD